MSSKNPSQADLKDIISSRGSETMKVLASPMKKWLENEILEVKIRKIIAIVEKNEQFGNGCSTCSFESITVKVFFKSMDGQLCVFTFTDSLQDIVLKMLRMDAELSTD